MPYLELVARRSDKMQTKCHATILCSIPFDSKLRQEHSTMSLMTHFAKWRTAILKRSPLFTLSRSLLLSKITAPIPDWMETRIEKDLAFYEKSGINSQKIENTLKKTRATGNWEAAKLYRLRIKENRLITQDNIYAIKDRRLIKLLFFFRTLLRKI